MANRLQEELSKFVGESDPNKIVEIGGVSELAGTSDEPFSHQFRDIFEIPNCRFEKTVL